MELITGIIALLVSIGLIIAIFQMNGRIGKLAEDLEDLVEIQQWQLVSTLVNEIEMSQKALDVLYRRDVLTDEQVKYIAKQKGWVE